jgi:hypothetical protein
LIRNNKKLWAELSKARFIKTVCWFILAGNVQIINVKYVCAPPFYWLSL